MSSKSEDLENESSQGSGRKCFPRIARRIAPYQQLATEESVLKKSINACTFAAFCMALNIKILQPNYAIMAAPGAHPESFENTNPFNFNSATYFIPMTSALGMAISSIFTGSISDKMGRKPVLLFCSIGCAIGGIIKYLTRKTFWGFCATNFLTGVMSGGLPVALGYVSDVYATDEEKQKGFSNMVSFWMFGQSFGGVIAILLEATGLFAPLLVGSAFMFISALLVVWKMIEASEFTFLTLKKAKIAEEATDEYDDLPEEIDQLALQNIVWGAFFDNFGSQALFPLCLSPLALEQFYADLVMNGEEPIMSLDAYKWLSVLVSLMVIPSAVICPKIFQKIGAAAACVFGNCMTGVITICLLYLGSGQPTKQMFAGFVTVLYLGFPFTVISQLTTSPMLDMIAPLDKRGYVQGINSTVMNFGIAIAPWLLGLMADAVGTMETIWTGAGISFFAGLVNSPLIFRKGFGPPPKVLPQESRPAAGEDKDLINKILKGEYVSGEDLHRINANRRSNGLPFLTIHPTPYSEDKEEISKFKKKSEPELRFWLEIFDDILVRINKKDKSLPSYIEQFNKSWHEDDENTKLAYQEIGQWFAEYLRDAGYQAHHHPQVIKQLILLAFPVILEEKELNLQNIEPYVLRTRRVLDRYVRIIENKKREEYYSLEAMTGNGMIPTIYG